jgi:ketosteroid isomerase-like protein
MHTEPRHHNSRNIFILIVLLAAATMATVTTLRATPDDHQKDRAAITQVLTNQVLSWNKGDTDSFMNGYWHSPDLTFSGTAGIQRGYDAVRDRYKRTYPDKAAMGHLDFSGLEFHFLGNDGALLLGHWHLTREKGDIGGNFSLVFQRFPDGWLIIHDHTSAETPLK